MIVKQFWYKPECQGDIPNYGRHGHTACEFKKNIVIFGGEKKFNSAIKIRECLNDTRIFNPETNDWKFLKSLGKIIEPRRNHSAAVNDRLLYVYGGISNHGNYLRDSWSLNLSNPFITFLFIIYLSII